MDSKGYNRIRVIIKPAFLAVIFIISFLLAGHPITIDGLFDDWDSVPLSYEDLPGDGMSIDFADLKITYDNDFLFIYFSIHFGEMLIQNENAIHVYIDADNDSLTGFSTGGIGAELDWTFGDRNGLHYFMDGITTIYQNDLTLRMAPTITSHEFEIAMSRSSEAFISEKSSELVQGKIIIAEAPPNSDQMPNEYGGVSFFIGEDYIMPPTPISFEKNDPNDIRIITQNVLSSHLVNPVFQEYFKRIYQTLDPDIIILQEMYENTNQLHSLISAWFPEDQWYVSGQFRDNIIISQYPILAQSFMTTSERTMVSLLGTEKALGSDLIVFSSHLACCDNNESRQYDSDEFVSRWRDWRENETGPFELTENTPFVYVGDLNLVGDSQQITTLTEGDIFDETTFGSDYALDWDGTSIADLFSRQTHKRMGYTWRRDNSSFSPGKLDYILYSDSVIDTGKHFVFNSMTMDSATLVEYDLDSLDSYYSSDHLPRILDIAVEDQINVESEQLIPTHFKLSNPYPNPFNPITRIQFELLTPDFIRIDLFDLKGKIVKNISQFPYSSGQYEIIVDGNELSSGIYFVRINGQHYSRSFKIVLMK